MYDEVNAEVVAVAMLEEQSCDGNAESVSRVLLAFYYQILVIFASCCRFKTCGYGTSVYIFWRTLL